MEGTEARKILAFVVIRAHFPLSSISLSFFLSLSPLYVRVCVGVCLCVCACLSVCACAHVYVLYPRCRSVFRPLTAAPEPICARPHLLTHYH